MSKKNLLNESQVRQFMKLAKLAPLTPGFVHGLTEKQGAVDKEDEHLGAKDGPESGKKQSLKDRRKEMRGEDRAEGDNPAAVEESHGRGRDEGAAGYGHPDANTRLEEEDELEAELGATEDELGDEDELADEEGDEIEDLEADAGAEGRTVSVDDFLAALETALEGVMGDEVEIDAQDLDDEPEAPPGDVEDVDVDVEDENVELQERASDDLVEQITKRVAARILKSALAKK